MFIAWGRKAVYRKQGYVADFCPLCRGPQAFLVKRIGMAGHLYYITVSQGDLVGFERTCEQCKTVFVAEPKNYRSMSKRLESLERLRVETHPTLNQVWAERIALEDRLRHSASQLTSEEREPLVREPFALLSQKVEAHFSSTQLDKEVGFSLIGAVALMVGGQWIARRVIPDDTALSLLVLMAAGLALVVREIARTGRRYMRREIIPVLAKSLRPLRPTPSEIATIIAELQRADLKMGKQLRADDLGEALQSPPPGMPRVT